MPMDMAPPLYLSNQEFVFRTCPKNHPAPLSFVDQTQLEDARPARRDARKAKRVTFADHKGLPLTRVKVFSQFKDPIGVPLDLIQEELSLDFRLLAEGDRLVLDFAQPASDYLHFRQSLERNCVCLERCVLKENVLAGTVKVKNLSFQKSVMLRVTFDTWKSHMDVDCVYVKDSYPSSYSDTFSFQVSLPDKLPPHQHVEFAICYVVGGSEYWDSNHGHNYRILWSSMRRRDQDACNRHTDSFDLGIHFDRFGSPTCSHGIFPDWPAYASCDNVGPYY
ncbi:protein phosphatase 1 regulatory subunit 3B isoform 1-T2 [Aulostomus maculatus]